MPIRVRGKIYRAIILSPKPYGDETWTVQEACEEATRIHDETFAVNREDQMAGLSDLHKSSQAGRTPFYERPPHH